MSRWRHILLGVASVLDPHERAAFAPTLDDIRRPGETGAQADARALASDWQRVGGDLREAIGRETKGLGR